WHFTRDAAKGTRLVSITYSNDKKQVQISEPESRSPATAWKTESVRVNGPETVPFSSLVVRPNGEQEPAALTKRQQLEREIQNVRKQASEAEFSGAPESVRAELKLKMAQLQRALEATPFEGVAGPAPFEEIKKNGAPIKTIAVSGLTEATRADLLSHLPV